MTLRYYGRYGSAGPCHAASGLAVKAAQARWSGLVYPFSRMHRLV